MIRSVEEAYVPFLVRENQKRERKKKKKERKKHSIHKTHRDGGRSGEDIKWSSTAAFILNL